MHAPNFLGAQCPLVRLVLGFLVGLTGFNSYLGCAAPAGLEDHAWRELTLLVTPGPRVDHAMAYDSRRSITVLFGGKELEAISSSPGYQEWSHWSDTALGDTWEFDGQIWWRHSPAHSPPAVYGHTMTFDEARGVVVLFGGKNGWRAGHRFISDIWEWDGRDWTQVATVDPVPAGRVDHGMVYDSQRSVHVLFGGMASEGGYWEITGETWEYDGAARTWTRRAGSGPAPRSQMGLAFDSAWNRTILFGGRPDTGDDFQYGDTWIWNGVAGTWTRHWGQDAPARLRMGLVYHGGLQSTMVVGGIVEYIDEYLAVRSVRTAWQPDTWGWEGLDWVAWPSANFCCLASPRAIVYESGRRQLLVFDTLEGIASEGEPPPPRTSVFSAVGNQPLPPILHVDPARVVEPQDGTFDHPFRAVRQAVDRATRGTVISIASGVYVEGPITFATAGRVGTSGGPVTLR
jgi:hypothetical protein